MTRFTLRAWDMRDLECLLKYANNSRIANNLTNRYPQPYREEDGLSFIQMAQKAKPLEIFAIAKHPDNEAIGSIGVHPQSDIYCKNAEIGYWLAEPFWGQGIATEALRQICTYAFANFEVERLFARPFGSNYASQRVLEKAGFVLEARLEASLFKNGRYEDELIYARRRKH